MSRAMEKIKGLMANLQSHEMRELTLAVRDLNTKFMAQSVTAQLTAGQKPSLGAGSTHRAITFTQWERWPPDAQRIIGMLNDDIATDGLTIQELKEQLLSQQKAAVDLAFQIAPMHTILGAGIQEALDKGGCLVEYRLAVRKTNMPEGVKVVADHAIYLGKADDFIDQAVGRIGALLRRAPMPDEFKSRTIIPSVEPEQLYEAIMLLAPYWGKPDYEDQLQRIFSRYLEPHYTKVGDKFLERYDAVDRFRKGARRTLTPHEQKLSTEAAVNKMRRKKAEK